MMRFSAKGTTQKLTAFVFGSALLLSGCTQGLEAAEKVTDFAETKISTFIDNHEYRTFPWELFLTDADSAILNEPDIPILESIDMNAYPLVESIQHINQMLDATNNVVNDYEAFEQNLDDASVLGTPLLEIYQSEEADDLFIEQIADMYNREYTYPERMDMVMLEQILVEDEHQWRVHLEWKALQDSNEFLVYPLILHLDEEYTYLTGTAKSPVSSAIYTKPLDTESVLDNNSHQVFLTQWEEFTRTFNNKTNEAEDLDDSHLQSIATENIELATLQSMFAASRGYLDNASFTGWKMHDKDADALSIYTLSIPTDHEGNVLTFEVTYSRPYDKIESIQPEN